MTQMVIVSDISRKCFRLLRLVWPNIFLRPACIGKFGGFHYFPQEDLSSEDTEDKRNDFGFSLLDLVFTCESLRSASRPFSLNIYTEDAILPIIRYPKRSFMNLQIYKDK